MNLTDTGKRAKAASLKLAGLSAAAKNDALFEICRQLEAAKADILAANSADMETAAAEGLSGPLLKRTKLDAAKLQTIIDGVKAIAALDDPIGQITAQTELADGLILKKVSCPIGVVGVIFEARPDALVQIAGLALKSGNAAILKGGREAAKTNEVLFSSIIKAGEKCGLPEGFLSLLTSREQVSELLTLDRYVDLIIPRGSNEFVRHIIENTKIPVMGHSDGVCHTYLDRDADEGKAVRVIVDAKTQYPAVCNATETLLVDRAAARLLPIVAKARSDKGVVIYGCPETVKLIGCKPHSGDWHHEYLDLEIAVKMVDGVQEAIDHINAYGSGHTDCIITENMQTAECFMDCVDSAGCYLNCSTRFADGYRYGFGAEVGVSTGKLHARGPVGLSGLTTYKYKLYGNGHIVSDFEAGREKFTHRPLK